ncbi:MAG: helix-turn-helix domain-containing protein [Myxococcota bacterium]
MGVLVAASEAEALVALLAELGPAEGAEDLRAAQLAFDPQRHRVILIDLALPGAENGVELAEWLRVRDAESVVLFGHRAEKALLQRAGAVGVDGYLMEPIQPEALRRCLRALLQRVQDSGGPVDPLPHLSLHQLERIETFVERALPERLLLEDMARELEMSRGHFSRLFKATTGASPYAFVTARRMDRAKELLRETSRSIGEVAAEVGFESQGHFATVFKRSTGRTPRAFRRAFAQTHAAD